MNPAFRCAALGAAIAGLPLAGATQTLSAAHEDPDAAGQAAPLRVELDSSAGSDGVETRLGLSRGHRLRAGLQGAVGLQARAKRLEADAPFADSRTQALGVSVHETLATGWGTLSFDAGSEQVRIEAKPQARRRVPVHRYALGAAFDLAPGWQLTGRWAHQEHAPREDQLFASGPAAGAWLAGDPSLGKAREDRAEVGVSWRGGPHRASMVLFESRYGNHLHLEATGRQRELAPGRALPELAWRQSPARVRGLEAQGRVRLRERRGGVLDLELRGALLHGTQEATGQPLPGLPSAQVGAALAGEHGAWGGRVGFDHATRQRRVPEGQLPGTSNTLWGAALSYRSKAAGADMLWYARVENLANRKASSAASLLAQGESGRAALQGRTLRVGVNASF